MQAVEEDSDEEMVAYSVSLLKLLSLRLDETTVQFFLVRVSMSAPKRRHDAGVMQGSTRDLSSGRATPIHSPSIFPSRCTIHPPSQPGRAIPPQSGSGVRFPLFSRAAALLKHPETMTRTSARTIVLNVLRLREQDVESFLVEGPSGDLVLHLTNAARAAAIAVQDTLDGRRLQQATLRNPGPAGGAGAGAGSGPMSPRAGAGIRQGVGAPLPLASQPSMRHLPVGVVSGPGMPLPPPSPQRLEFSSSGQALVPGRSFSSTSSGGSAPGAEMVQGQGQGAGVGPASSGVGISMVQAAREAVQLPGPLPWQATCGLPSRAEGAFGEALDHLFFVSDCLESAPARLADDLRTCLWVSAAEPLFIAPVAEAAGYLEMARAAWIRGAARGGARGGRIAGALSGRVQPTAAPGSPVTPRPSAPGATRADQDGGGGGSSSGAAAGDGHQPPAPIRAPAMAGSSQAAAPSRTRSQSSVGTHSLGASHGGMRPGAALVLLGSALRVQTDARLLQALADPLLPQEAPPADVLWGGGPGAGGQTQGGSSTGEAVHSSSSPMDASHQVVPPSLPPPSNGQVQGTGGQP